MILSMSFLLTRYKRDSRESLSPLISSLKKGIVRAGDVKSKVYKGILYYLPLQEWNELFLGFDSNVVEKELSLRTRSFILISPPIILVTL
ncbi:hypothetical protein M9H77_13278 [Catharanthus roseus]|uniref:Uncharacterized protein n=1 Tax=Catharanthus roseus TaxID=4058 RepID=A0ACC0BJV2_CATRO|nr:hypothetical protein M9H77_13278 [Catharanthus roseus]